MDNLRSELLHIKALRDSARSKHHQAILDLLNQHGIQSQKRKSDLEQDLNSRF